MFAWIHFFGQQFNRHSIMLIFDFVIQPDSRQLVTYSPYITLCKQLQAQCFHFVLCNLTGFLPVMFHCTIHHSNMPRDEVLTHYLRYRKPSNSSWTSSHTTWWVWHYPRFDLAGENQLAIGQARLLPSLLLFLKLYASTLHFHFAHLTWIITSFLPSCFSFSSFSLIF